MQARMETVTCFDNGHIVIMMRIVIILSIMIIGAFEKFLQVLKRIQRRRVEDCYQIPMKIPTDNTSGRP